MGLFLTLSEYLALGSVLFYAVVLGLAKGPKNPAALNILEYLHRLTHGIQHMILSSESSGKAQQDADLIRDSKEKVIKTIVFVRHGESVWNEVFNRGFGPSFIFRLVNALILEARMALSLDSVFFDTPLSKLGIEQAAKLVKQLDAHVPGKDPAVDRVIAVLKGESAESVQIISSNLRRAIQTAVVGNSLRSKKVGNERIKILSDLQEMSRNVDTQSWLPAGQVPKYSLGIGFIPKVDPKETFEASQNSGNKSIKSTGADRQKNFCKYVFSQQEEVFIVYGHSLWFKNFFKNFLGQNSLHESKKHKIVNCGVVTFQLAKAVYKRPNQPDGPELYRIDAQSIKSVYGGFDKKGK